MEVLLAVVIGAMFACSLYLMMRRSIVRLIIGLALLSYTVNLLIFTVGRLTRAEPPIIPEGENTLQGLFADPLPQALILTAIVIGFGVQAFSIVLIRQVSNTLNAEDVDEMRTTDLDPFLDEG